MVIAASIGIIGDLIAHSGPQQEGRSVPKLGEQFALQAIHDVPRSPRCSEALTAAQSVISNGIFANFIAERNR